MKEKSGTSLTEKETLTIKNLRKLSKILQKSSNPLS